VIFCCSQSLGEGGFRRELQETIKKLGSADDVERIVRRRVLCNAFRLIVIFRCSQSLDEGGFRCECQETIKKLRSADDLERIVRRREPGDVGWSWSFADRKGWVKEVFDVTFKRWSTYRVRVLVQRWSPRSVSFQGCCLRISVVVRRWDGGEINALGV